MNSNAVGRPMEVLLLEDSLTAARLTISALRHGGIPHHMTWLSDGEDALDFLFHRGRFARAPRPDLILLDLGLPGKDGREVLAEIRAVEEFESVPVVVLTASTRREDILETERLRVEGYLTKPVDITRFLQLIRDLAQFWRADMILPTA